MRIKAELCNDVKGTLRVRSTNKGSSQADTSVKTLDPGDLHSIATLPSHLAPSLTQATGATQALQSAATTKVTQKVQDLTAS